ncbi:conserved hypothetical protein [Pseudoalteromonas sp. 3J6]|uniref:hypothetical protein n=1 Tax=Pseudoalteromonas sp. 3J6 TaxID=649161 RepID=UPI001754651D|nr:hypothetical protein [Pseudoalteromonas sp. 3J6]CAD2225016.1 conserved hypothetical protein [Pseudoalteromonas sp. 3J6]
MPRFRIVYQELFTAKTEQLDITAASLAKAHQHTLTLDVYVLSVKPIIRVTA